MKTHTHIYDPELKTFLRFFVFIFGSMLLIVTLTYLLFDFGSPVKDYLKSVGFMLFVYPVINSVIGAYSARKHVFNISAIDDPAFVAGWAVALLQKNDMIIAAAQPNQTILESTGSFYKWYSKMFGTVPATVSYNEQAVTITGLSKHVDIIDSKIKFGHVDFKEQPYKHL